MSKKTKKRQSPEKKKSSRYRNLPAGSIIFFACTYLYVLLIIESRLIYHSFGTFITYPAFSVDREFFKSSLKYPGGIVEYIGGFLSQLYYFSWLGALIVTAIALIIYIAARILVRLSAGDRLKLISYIPVVILLMVYSRYDNQVNTFIALSVALWLLVVYEKLIVRSSAAAAAKFIVMFALLYYIAGWANLIFALLAAIYEFFNKRRRVLGVIMLTAAIGFYLVMRYIFYLETEIIPVQELNITLKPDPWIKILMYSLYFFFPLVLFAAGLRQVLAGKKEVVKGSKMNTQDKSRPAKKPWWNFNNNKAKLIIAKALPIVILAAGVFISFDSTKKRLVQVDYFAHNKMWPEVLRTADKIRPESYDIFCIHDVNRALYHTGQLGDKMFGYPQKLQALILTGSQVNKPSGRIFLKRSQILLQLGHVGIAERDAFESLELVGSSPVILEQLATIKIAKGQVEAAKVFLKALSRDLIYGDRGRRMLARLEKDPGYASDSLIRYIRSVALDKDSVSFNYGVGEFFQQLLVKNPGNRHAFEYLMAVYLLSGQLDQIAANIGRLNILGYERMPRCYEEAILIFIGMGNTKINLHGWKLKPETISRIKEVDRVYKLQGGKNNEQDVRKTLGKDFADSYFLYYLFDLSRAGR